MVQIISDSGDHELSEVFKVMSEGESLPVCFEKELKVSILILKPKHKYMVATLILVVNAVIKISEHTLLHLPEAL